MKIISIVTKTTQHISGSTIEITFFVLPSTIRKAVPFSASVSFQLFSATSVVVSLLKVGTLLFPSLFEDPSALLLSLLLLLPLSLLSFSSCSLFLPVDGELESSSVL